MSKKYYTFPLRLGEIMRKNEHPTCNLHESIAQYIHLMITSQFKENKNDEAFGNMLWENEFGNIMKNNNLREKVKLSLLQTIQRYEQRLENVRVEIQMHQEEVASIQMKQLRERVNIEITGIIVKSKEKFKHYEHFYIAPLSYY